MSLIEAAISPIMARFICNNAGLIVELQIHADCKIACS